MNLLPPLELIRYFTPFHEYVSMANAMTSSSRATRPLVSIMTPIYRVEDYVVRCVTSVLEQTYSELELIVVDDASPDDSVSRLLDLLAMHPRAEAVRLLRHPSNRGLAVARQTALSAARGSYLVWLDGDDYLADHTVVEHWVDLAVRTGAAIVSSDYRADYARRQRYFSVRSYPTGRAYALGILRGETPAFMCNKLIRRADFIPGHWVEGQNMLEDLGAIIPTLLSLDGSIVHLSEASFCYVQYNEHSLISSSSRLKVDQVDALLSRVACYLRETEDDELIQAGQTFRWSMGRVMLERGHHRDYAYVRQKLLSHRPKTFPEMGLWDRWMLHLQLDARWDWLGYLMSLVKRTIRCFYYGG